METMDLHNFHNPSRGARVLIVLLWQFQYIKCFKTPRIDEGSMESFSGD